MSDYAEGRKEEHADPEADPDALRKEHLVRGDEKYGRGGEIERSQVGCCHLDTLGCI